MFNVSSIVDFGIENMKEFQFDLEQIDWDNGKFIAATNKSIIYKVFLHKKNYTIPMAVKIFDAKKLHVKQINQILNSYKTFKTLSHPNIIENYGFFLKDNLYFFITEWFEPYYKVDRKIPCSISYSIIKNLASVLVYLMSKKVVHGDIQPSNILINEDGIVKLIDFELCRLISDSIVGFGSTLYLAPEQRKGVQTHASDIYSMGLAIKDLIDINDKCFEKCTMINNIIPSLIGENQKVRYHELNKINRLEKIDL